MLTKIRFSPPLLTGNWSIDGPRLLVAISNYFLVLNQKSALEIDEARIRAAQGIVFPATQVASTDANTLDDYNEPAWTPTGNAITFASAVGAITKAGRLIIAGFDVTWPATADGSDARIGGLSYTTNASGASGGGALSFTDYGSADVLVRAVSGQSYGVLSNHSGVALTNANVSGKRFIGALITYV